MTHATTSPHEPTTFRAGRVLLGTCFVLDAVWILASYDVRVAYMDAVGGPHLLIWLTALVYAVCGLALAAGRHERAAALGLGLVLLLMSVVLLTRTDVHGIGEYPPEFHLEVLFKEWLVHLGIIGALLLASGGSQHVPARDLRAATHAGRILVGGYFVVNALWQWAYFDIRVSHIVASGGSGKSLPFVIGLQLVGGALVAAGVAVRAAAAPLMLVIVASTIVVHGNLSASAPYPPNAQIHQWFVKASILAGLLMAVGEASRARAGARVRTPRGSGVQSATSGGAPA